MGRGLLVTLSETHPTLIELAGESIELHLHKKKWKGLPMISIKANADVKITGAHLLQKLDLDREKLKRDIEDLVKKNHELQKQLNERNA
jgi:hypothetical protein